jgi:hypothetical protein
MKQISASKTDILLQCAYSFDPELVCPPREAREGARYGSAAHELMAIARVKDSSKAKRAAARAKAIAVAPAIAAEYRVPDSDKLLAHVDEALAYLDSWMGGQNPFKINFSDPKRLEDHEISYAILPGTMTGRRCQPPRKEDHVYSDLKEGEIGGTIDLLNQSPAATPRRQRVTLLLDYKTGMDDDGDFSIPSKLAQLRTLALPFRDTCSRLIVAVLHMPRFGLPAINADELEADVLLGHGEALVKAIARIGDGSLRPGPACRYCSARAVCPTRPDDRALLDQAALLLDKAQEKAIRTSEDKSLTFGEKMSRLYNVVRLGEDLARRSREEIRVATKAGLLKGFFKIQAFDEERLSKQRFIDTYGKAAFERMAAKWRKDGALVKSPVEKLVQDT